MKRLPISGRALWTPERSRDDLAGILREAGVPCDETATKKIHHHLGAIIGSWWQERKSMETKPVAKALISLAESLQEASQLLSGHSTGLRHGTAIEVTSQVQPLLAKDPDVGDIARAGAFLERFMIDAAKVREHCRAAYANLAGKGPPGRTALGWHDDFTELLLNLAQEAGVKSTIKTDRITGERSGWLLEVAMELETFLPREMRSPSVAARAKRLERSKKKLKARNDKN